MVSVAVLDFTRTRVLSVAEWSIVQKLLVKQVASEVLRGVGLTATDTPDKDVSITHVLRRQCTDDERRRVLEKYVQ